MRRVALSLVLLTGLAGCGVGSIPLPTGFNPDSEDTGSGSRGDLALSDAHKTGVSDADVIASAGEEEVAPDSGAKAPKGALSDRDYSATKLDPEQAIELINAYRAQHSLEPLKLDAKLMLAAKMHSRDLAKHDRISHYGSDGSSPWDRVARTGFNARLAAENVGTGQASLAEVLKGWEQSEAHNRNLLLAEATHMGIALAQNPKSEFHTFWTLVVGTPM